MLRASATGSVAPVGHRLSDQVNAQDLNMTT